MQEKRPKTAQAVPARAKPKAAAGSAAKKKKRPVKKTGIVRPAGFKKRFLKLFDSWFYRVYFPLVAVAVIAIFIGLHWLRGFAADYESAQPIHVADEVGQMFVNGDYDRLYALDTAAQALSGGDQAYYVQSLRDVAEGGRFEWNESYASGGDALQYDVTLNGSRFASFTLIPTGLTTAHGNPLYQLGTVTTHLAVASDAAPADPAQAPCRIQAPAGYTVAVDGRALGEGDVIRTGIVVYPDGFLPRGVEAPVLTEYGFTPEGDSPDIRVTDASGAEAPTRLESENIWLCPPREDAAIREKYAEAVTKLAERIAKYTTADISQSSALSDVIDDSPAETTLKAFKNDWAPSHKSERFEDMTLSDFCLLSEDCFACHVKFNYILTSKRQNDYPYETEYTFCIVRKGDEGKLYNLMFH